MIDAAHAHAQQPAIVLGARLSVTGHRFDGRFDGGLTAVSLASRAEAAELTIPEVPRRMAALIEVGKLHFVEARIGPTACHQLLVGADLGDDAILDHGNLVRPPDGGKAVRDHEDGAIGHQVCQRLLHQHLGLGIEFRSRLVQNQDGRIL